MCVIEFENELKIAYTLVSPYNPSLNCVQLGYFTAKMHQYVSTPRNLYTAEIDLTVKFIFPKNHEINTSSNIGI